MASSGSALNSYMVEHLATFSTSLPAQQQQQITPKMAIQRLFAMEKTSGIWSQRMLLKLDGSHMLILDGESNDIVERFSVNLIQSPISFNYRDHMYNNILIFTVQHPNETQGELHIFNCASHSAQQIVSDINNWLKKFGNLEMSNDHPNQPNSIPVNVHVKDAVNAFNALAAQREKKSSSPVIGSSPQRRSPLGPSHNVRDHDSRSVTTTSSIDSNHNGASRNNSHDQSLSNERCVSILNHCFDDIERFILRLQHAAAALRELQLRSHKRQGKGAAHGGDGLLAMRARGPNEEEFYEILSKFKLAFNLLAKLKGCIHDPNAPELVHFLFTPLAIIIEAARSNGSAPIDTCVVEVPFLSLEAIDLLSNCCTSKEYDLWQSLGSSWTHPIRQRISSPARLGAGSYQPVFTDGWAPTITDPDLMGFNSSSEASEHDEEEARYNQRDANSNKRDRINHSRHHSMHYVDSDNEDHIDHSRISPSHKGRHALPSPIDSAERDSLSTANLNEIEQSEWLSELQSRGSKIVQVLYPRTANNSQELSVIKGEILEILDSTRNWWKARNSRGQVGHVPNTLLDCEMSGLHLRDDQGSSLSRGSHDGGDWIRKERQGKKGEFRYF